VSCALLLEVLDALFFFFFFFLKQQGEGTKFVCFFEVEVRESTSAINDNCRTRQRETHKRKEKRSACVSPRACYPLFNVTYFSLGPCRENPLQRLLKRKISNTELR